MFSFLNSRSVYTCWVSCFLSLFGGLFFFFNVITKVFLFSEMKSHSTLKKQGTHLEKIIFLILSTFVGAINYLLGCIPVPWHGTL